MLIKNDFMVVQNLIESLSRMSFLMDSFINTEIFHISTTFWGF